MTLRAVAREVGIAAPSIYAHFPDRDAIVLAVVARVFDELAVAIEAGVAAAGGDVVDRLVGGCEGYVTFGLAHPSRYRALFSGDRVADPDLCRPVVLEPDGVPVLAFGAEAFSLLLEAISACVAAGRSTSSDVVGDATAVWVAMHGMISLRTALEAFPWPERHTFVRRLVLALAHVEGAVASPS